MQPNGMPDEAARALAGIPARMMVDVIIIWVSVFAISYFLTCYPLFMIGKKLQREDAWWAWVPIIGAILACRIAGKPEWWVVLFLVPIANIVIPVIVWMGISVACGKPEWLGILMLVPVAGFVIPFYLAFG